jgi:CheY-like chemotaxis protein
MSARCIRLLLVEDDALQRKLLQAHLNKLTDLRFEVTPADSEDDAVRRLGDGFDLVLLDYHLSGGNGLSCLRRIRMMEPHLPIIAVSGVATSEVAAELLEAGADDYFSKDGFEPEVFSRSVRAALARADAWKARAPDHDSGLMSEIVGLFDTTCAEFAASAGPTLAGRLDKIEDLARKASLTFPQTLKIFESVCEKLAHGKDPNDLKRTLRPIMLDVVLRLFEEVPARGGK